MPAGKGGGLQCEIKTGGNEYAGSNQGDPALRHRRLRIAPPAAGVGKISDIPGYWEKINLEYGAALTTLHDTYRQSRHCEVAVCFDLDERQACFTYMLGVGVDGADAAVPQRPGTYRRRIQGGLYAVFTTPRVAEDQYVQSIHDTWGQVLGSWLPQSGYEYDEAREGYEYYDERDHGETAQMDIYVPVRKRGKA